MRFSFNIVRKFAVVMKNRTLSIALAALIFGASCSEKPIDHQAEFLQLKSTNKLILARTAISKTARKETSEWYKIGKRIAVYSYDSYLHAYVDLGELTANDLTFDDEARTVTVTLPPIKIESAGRDMELKREYENIGLMRSDLDSKERAEMKEKANEDFRREISENSSFRNALLAAARQKARLYIESLFAAQGYTATVIFKPEQKLL